MMFWLHAQKYNLFPMHEKPKNIKAVLIHSHITIVTYNKTLA